MNLVPGLKPSPRHSSIQFFFVDLYANSFTPFIDAHLRFPLLGREGGGTRAPGLHSGHWVGTVGTGRADASIFNTTRSKYDPTGLGIVYTTEV